MIPNPLSSTVLYWIMSLLSHNLSEKKQISDMSRERFSCRAVKWLCAVLFNQDCCGVLPTAELNSGILSPSGTGSLFSSLYSAPVAHKHLTKPTSEGFIPATDQLVVVAGPVYTMDLKTITV